MVKKLFENGNYKNILITILIGIVGWLAINVYAMTDKFVRLQRYNTDQTRIEKTLCDIQKDIKEILRMLK